MSTPSCLVLIGFMYRLEETAVDSGRSSVGFIADTRVGCRRLNAHAMVDQVRGTTTKGLLCYYPLLLLYCNYA